MNSYWEDQGMSDELKKCHNETVENMGVPHWAIFDCPFCEEKLDPRAVRSISLCFNARNIGDVAVEFCCDKCSKMDTMYFRQAAKDTEEFAHLVDSNRYGHTPKSPKSDPLIEEEMYALQYNNLVEKLHFHKEE